MDGIVLAPLFYLWGSRDDIRELCRFRGELTPSPQKNQVTQSCRRWKAFYDGTGLNVINREKKEVHWLASSSKYDCWRCASSSYEYLPSFRLFCEGFPVSAVPYIASKSSITIAEFSVESIRQTPSSRSCTSQICQNSYHPRSFLRSVSFTAETFVFLFRDKTSLCISLSRFLGFASTVASISL